MHYAVVRKEDIWRLYQCGQEIRVFHCKADAVLAAREMAWALRDVAQVRVLVQSPTGELETEALTAQQHWSGSEGGGDGGEGFSASCPRLTCKAERTWNLSSSPGPGPASRAGDRAVWCFARVCSRLYVL